MVQREGKNGRFSFIKPNTGAVQQMKQIDFVPPLRILFSSYVGIFENSLVFLFRRLMPYLAACFVLHHFRSLFCFLFTVYSLPLKAHNAPHRCDGSKVSSSTFVAATKKNTFLMSLILFGSQKHPLFLTQFKYKPIALLSD